MSEEQAKNGQELELNKKESLGFAVTLLAALGTILYAGYIYL